MRGIDCPSLGRRFVLRSSAPPSYRADIAIQTRRSKRVAPMRPMRTTPESLPAAVSA